MPYAKDVIPFTVSHNGIHLDWEAVTLLAKNINYYMFYGSFIPKQILCLGRGGMIASRLLAKEKTPIFYVGVSSREKMDSIAIRVHQAFTDDDYARLNDEGTLIVDDLWDTGETFRWAHRHWPKARRAALLSKASEPDEIDRPYAYPDYIGLHLPLESWIHFPWEE